MTYKLKGLKSLQRQLKAIDESMRPKVLQKAMRGAFKMVLESAISKVPVDSGQLRSALSLAGAKGGKGNDRAVAVGIIVKSSSTAMKQANTAAAAFGESQSRLLPPSRRWHFIELGTRYQRAQPFIRPALDENADAVFNRLADELKKQIKKAVK